MKEILERLDHELEQLDAQITALRKRAQGVKAAPAKLRLRPTTPRKAATKAVKRACQVCRKCGRAGHNARSCGRKPKSGRHAKAAADDEEHAAMKRLDVSDKQLEQIFDIDVEPKASEGLPAELAIKGPRRRDLIARRARALRPRGRKNACSVCGERSHNAKTCPQGARAGVEQPRGECECGNPKPVGAAACEQCIELDGRRRTQSPPAVDDLEELA